MRKTKKRGSETLTEGVEKIVVPYSYATVQSILAFFMSILCERMPIIPVRGDGPMDVTPAGYMESVLHYQMENMSPPGTLIIFQWLLDAWRYGVGIVKNLYTVREWVDLVRTFSTDPLTGQQTDDVQEEDVTAYEGNEALNVSPFDWYPDPGRPMSEFQRGDFVFHQTRRSYTELLVREKEGVYVGTKNIPKGLAATQGDGGRYTGGFEENSAIPRMVGMDEPYGDDARRSEERKSYCQIDEGWMWLTPGTDRQVEAPRVRPRDHVDRAAPLGLHAGESRRAASVPSRRICRAGASPSRSSSRTTTFTAPRTPASSRRPADSNTISRGCSTRG